MRSRVGTRARLRQDRGGDPLDGLVNLFDIGIVLALAFLLVALASLEAGARSAGNDEIVVRPREALRPLPERGERAVGRGRRVGAVYRLADGRLVYVARE